MDKDKPRKWPRLIGRVATTRTCRFNSFALFTVVISVASFCFVYRTYYTLKVMEEDVAVAAENRIAARYSNDDFLRFHTGPRYLKPDNPNLIRYIFNLFGGPSRQSYNLTNPNRTDYSRVGQSKFVDKLLDGRRDGFFVESAARDGETDSNTLFFERQRDWRGLLIEANPVAFLQLMYKRRQTYTLNACLNPGNQSKRMVFRSAGLIGSLQGRSNTARHEALKKHPDYLGHDVTVQCLPFSSIMAAGYITHVDYLALSLHGIEADVLATVPFDELRVDVVSVEYRVTVPGTDKIDTVSSLRQLADVRHVFDVNGLYKEVGILPEGKNDKDTEAKGLDVFFKRIDS